MWAASIRSGSSYVWSSVYMVTILVWKHQLENYCEAWRIYRLWFLMRSPYSRMRLHGLSQLCTTRSIDNFSMLHVSSHSIFIFVRDTSHGDVTPSGDTSHDDVTEPLFSICMCWRIQIWFHFDQANFLFDQATHLFIGTSTNYFFHSLGLWSLSLICISNDDEARAVLVKEECRNHSDIEAIC